MAGGRPPGQSGLPKKSGRQKGSIDRAERQLVTSELAHDILSVYRAMGGVTWLLSYAQAHPGPFLAQALSRLFPAYQKEPGEGDGNVYNTQINVDNMSDLDAARRVAFLLAKAAHELDDATGTDLAAYRYEPAPAYDRDCNPQEVCHADDPAKDAWAESLAQTEDERICAETQTASIETYRGGAGEGLVDRPRRKRDLI